MNEKFGIGDEKLRAVMDIYERNLELEAENADLRDCIEIMEDACDILRKENFRLFQQIFADEKLKQEEEHR